MALIGINSALPALKADEVLREAHSNAFSGKALRRGATAGSGSNLKISEYSLVRNAVSNTSGNFQPIEPNDVGGSRIESTGREPTSEVRKTILPFLENLRAQNKEGLVDVLLSFPDLPPAKKKILPPAKKKILPPVKKKILGLKSGSKNKSISTVYEGVNLSDYPHLEEHVVDGQLRSSLKHFLSLGVPPNELESIVSRYPMITSYSVEGKIKPVVDFLLGMGVAGRDIPKIVLKRPQLFGCSLEENIRPMATLLEGLGVEPERWAKILVSFPHILTYSSAKVDLVVKYLAEMGMTTKESGRVLTRFPHIVGYSVEDKLKPITNHLNSIGIVDLKVLVLRSPQFLGLSLELNIKPTLQFFTDNGYTREELSTIILRFPQILGLNIEGNLRTKWEYLLQMGRSKEEIVLFPQYFGYNLENRIKPRYEALRSSGVDWSLNRMLTTTEILFQKHLERDRRIVRNLIEIELTDGE